MRRYETEENSMCLFWASHFILYVVTSMENASRGTVDVHNSKYRLNGKWTMLTVKTVTVMQIKITVEDSDKANHVSLCHALHGYCTQVLLQ